MRCKQPSNNFVMIVVSVCACVLRIRIDKRKRNKCLFARLSDSIVRKPHRHTDNACHHARPPTNKLVMRTCKHHQYMKCLRTYLKPFSTCHLRDSKLVTSAEPQLPWVGRWIWTCLAAAKMTMSARIRRRHSTGHQGAVAHHTGPKPRCASVVLFQADGMQMHLLGLRGGWKPSGGFGYLVAIPWAHNNGS